MRRISFSLYHLLIILLLAPGCIIDYDQVLPDEVEEEEEIVEKPILLGQFLDVRDSQIYTTVEYPELGQKWLAENLNYESPNSWCYNNDPQNCEDYGRLYTWEAALNSCPEGWHLPSITDINKLVHYFGTGEYPHEPYLYRDSYFNLISGGVSGFNLLCSGSRFWGDGSFNDLQQKGFYWSSEDYELDPGNKMNLEVRNTYPIGLSRRNSPSEMGFSCRCIEG